MPDKHIVYTHAFDTEYGKEILEDLSNFCFAERAYLDTSKKISMSQDGKNIIGVSQIDSHEIARFEGRREVFLFIKNMMKKPSEIEEEYEED